MKRLKVTKKTKIIFILIALSLTLFLILPDIQDLVSSGLRISYWFSLLPRWQSTGGCNNELCWDGAVQTISALRIISIFLVIYLIMIIMTLLLRFFRFNNKD